MIDQELLYKALEKWGHETQVNKLQEETLELALILNQRNCPTKNPKRMEHELYTELADVTIMMEQAKILFDKDKIDKYVKIQLEKLKKHLE